MVGGSPMKRGGTLTLVGDANACGVGCRREEAVVVAAAHAKSVAAAIEGDKRRQDDRGCYEFELCGLSIARGMPLALPS